VTRHKKGGKRGHAPPKGVAVEKRKGRKKGGKDQGSSEFFVGLWRLLKKKRRQKKSKAKGRGALVASSSHNELRREKRQTGGG